MILDGQLKVANLNKSNSWYILFCEHLTYIPGPLCYHVSYLGPKLYLPKSKDPTQQGDTKRLLGCSKNYFYLNQCQIPFSKEEKFSTMPSEKKVADEKMIKCGNL